jgi:hypothetical protein
MIKKPLTILITLRDKQMNTEEKNIFDNFDIVQPPIILETLQGSMIIGDAPKAGKGIRKYVVNMLIGGAGITPYNSDVEMTAKQAGDFASCEGKAFVNHDGTLSKLVRKS